MDWNEIMTMNEDELKALNLAIVNRIKQIREIKSRKVRRAISVGDKVKFNSSKFGTLYGKVSKINLKTIDVMTGVGMFRVTASLIKKENEDAKV